MGTSRTTRIGESPTSHGARAVQAPCKDAPGRRRRVSAETRVVAVALFAGAATALALSLAVFPGSTEGVITGSMLVGFGTGWALMWAMSTRLTDRPQRWAVVPAIGMGGLGLALMVGSPDNDTMTTLTWVWPSAMLALVVWMVVQAGRRLRSRGRWLLAPVFVFLAVASAGAMVQNVSTQRNEDNFPAPGTTYSVGDHRLHLDCRGQAAPTVVLFNGLGEISDSWAKVTAELSSRTRVCAFDRAGQGWSDDVDSPQDGIAAADDLHELLKAAGEPGPFVLVGHSIGGPYAMTFAARYPDQVAGMVLLDGSSPHQFTAMPDYPGKYAVMERLYSVLPAVVRVGAGGLVASGAGYPSEVAERLDAMTSTPRAARSNRDQIATVPILFEQSQALTTLGDRPLAVITASETVADSEGWSAAQDELAALSTNRAHGVVDSSHQGLLDDEAGAAESARAIEAVLAAVRAPGVLVDSSLE